MSNDKTYNRNILIAVDESDIEHILKNKNCSNAAR